MIKEILEIFRKDSLMSQAYDESFKMLEATEKMFLSAKDTLRNCNHNVIDDWVLSKDLEVNHYQRDVRRKVLKHLATSITNEINTGLVLISIIIDIERIGDHAKNLIETAIIYKPRLMGGQYEQNIKIIESGIEENFKKTIICFKNSDVELGKYILSQYSKIYDLINSVLTVLIRYENRSFRTNDVAALVMYLRTLKRIFAHLNNITTSVVNPFDRIGYKPLEILS